MTHSRPPTPTRSARYWWIGLTVILGLGLLATQLVPEHEDLLPGGDFAPVERGPLTISVASAGSIRSGNAVSIKNKVEGRTTILWIIEEGTPVEENQILMELDSSELEDERLEEEIEVETSKAALVNAQQMLEIARKRGQANIAAAVVEYRLALLDVEKYSGIGTEQYERLLERGAPIDEAMKVSFLGELNALAGKVAEDGEERQQFIALLGQLEGGYKQELRKALNQIIIVQAELRRAEDYYQDSLELYSQDFIAATELQADELDLQRKKLELEVTVGELALLARFTYRRTIEELSSAVTQRKFALEMARHEAKANVVDAEANLHSRRERLVRKEQSVREVIEQIEACEVRAPQSGMVVYGTTGRGRDDRDEPLAEGVEVRERQELFRLPTTDKLIADIKIHESMLEKVRVGMPVQITTDALPGRSFRGKLTSIAVLPDGQSRWYNPSLKVYNSVAEIIGDRGDLRTGMSCRTEIIVKEFVDTLYIPIQAVIRVGGVPTVYLPTPDGELMARVIDAGMDDNRMMQVRGGLQEGDLVSLTPPLEEGETSLADERERDRMGARDRMGERDRSEDAGPPNPAGDGPISFHDDASRTGDQTTDSSAPPGS